MIAKQNIIAFASIKGIGSNFVKKYRAVLKEKGEDIYEILKLKKIEHVLEIQDYLDYAESIMESCEKLGIKIISIIDDEYPSNLLEIKDPPAVIYIKGNEKILNKAVGIIGTRKSTDLGNKIASKVGLYFSKNWAICNGLVEGIDKNSIYFDNVIASNVISVLSCGLNLDKSLNKKVNNLANEVLGNNGLLISEFEPNKMEDRFSGSKASRIQAGLSNALILIQSSNSGGSKYTIKAFSELNRPLGIINFKNSNEFNTDITFQANRLILEKGKNAIMEICNIKNLSNIFITEIVSIENTNDYVRLEKLINNNAKLEKLSIF